MLQHCHAHMSKPTAASHLQVLLADMYAAVVSLARSAHQARHTSKPTAASYSLQLHVAAALKCSHIKAHRCQVLLKAHFCTTTIECCGTFPTRCVVELSTTIAFYQRCGVLRKATVIWLVLPSTTPRHLHSTPRGRGNSTTLSLSTTRFHNAAETQFVVEALWNFPQPSPQRRRNGPVYMSTPLCSPPRWQQPDRPTRLQLHVKAHRCQVLLVDVHPAVHAQPDGCPQDVVRHAPSSSQIQNPLSGALYLPPSSSGPHSFRRTTLPH